MKPSRKKKKIITPSGQIVHLTPKQKLYADTKLANPDMPLNEVAHLSYPEAAAPTLKQIANYNEKNIDITIYNQEQIIQASKNIVEIANDIGVKSETRLKANDSILDRAYGKATTRTEVTSTNLNLNIEASQELNTDFAAYLKQKTQQTD